MGQPGIERAAAHAGMIAEALRNGRAPDGVELVHTPRGRGVAVTRLPAVDMAGAFGLSAPGPTPVVLLRTGLPARIERTVLGHELNHVDDFADDPAPRHWLVREWRATAPLLRSDPVGVLATAVATLTDRERRRFYRARLRSGR